MANICKHPEGCPRPARRKGWCALHYQRISSKGDPGPAEYSPVRTAPCPDCEKPVVSRSQGPLPVCADCRRERNRLQSAKYRDRNRSDPEWLAERAVKMSAWRQANPEAWARLARKRELRGAYKLTVEDYEAMLAAQGGLCAVVGCGAEKADAAGRRLHVDHDHNCCPGKRSCGNCVRGLLCKGCNSALGHAGDNPDRLRALADYLESPRQLRIVG